MKYPTFNNLKRWGKRGDEMVSFAQNMHPNPRFYKYYWHVFSKDSEFEGEEFFNNCRMSSYEANMKIMKLLAVGETFMVFNYRRPRQGPDTPFNLSKAKVWASAYDDDPDLPCCEDAHK